MEMKPCPFCGLHDPNFEKDGHPAPTPIVVGDDKKNIRYVECEQCGARGPISEDHFLSQSGWNTRDRVDALEGALASCRVLVTMDTLPDNVPNRAQRKAAIETLLQINELLP